MWYFGPYSFGTKCNETRPYSSQVLRKIICFNRGLLDVTFRTLELWQNYVQTIKSFRECKLNLPILASADNYFNLNYNLKPKIVHEFEFPIKNPSKWGIICQNWWTLKKFGWWTPMKQKWISKLRLSSYLTNFILIHYFLLSLSSNIIL